MRPRRLAPLLGLLLALAVLVAAGVIARAAGQPAVSDALWLAGTAAGVVTSLVLAVRSLRAGSLGVDVVALLALVGAAAVGEYLAGVLVALMLATGRVLEERAQARAGRSLSELVARSPRSARREGPAGLAVVDVAEVSPGDRLVVGSGEVVPVDGRLLGPAVLDESTLTGEPLPVDRGPGEDVRSGALNAGPPARMVATATSEASTYAGIVRLVEQAGAESAPFVRVADRVAAGFVPFALAFATLAWAVSGDPVRAVAVLVVATPCPLLLAAPVAVLSGVSRAARLGVVMKGGGPLERLAEARVLLLDKTGTLTRGRPDLSDVVTGGAPSTAPDTVLRLAASLEQVSGHVLAGAVVRGARSRGLPLDTPEGVEELPGSGVAGTVAGRAVRVGRLAWVHPGPAPGWVDAARRRAAADGAAAVFVAVDGRPAGVLLLSDELRPDAVRTVRALRAAGIRRVVLLTGDRADVADSVARLVGVDAGTDAVHAECSPGDKVAVVRDESRGARTVMCGDGVNDAAALAAADVGVAVAGQGAAGASTEAADVVLTTDRFGALADAIAVARRSRRIAVEAVVVGMGLSLVAMAAAAVGRVPPAAGALLQEGVDVLAIVVALRALLPGRGEHVRVPDRDVDAVARMAADHHRLRGLVEEVRVVADGLDDGPAALARVADLVTALETELLPHEDTEERELVPLVERVYRARDPLATLSRTHAEIRHRVGRLRRLTEVDADVPRLRAELYGLHAVLRLHNTQEEEGVYSLLPPEESGVAARGR
ncbi:MAG: heavy metal translocating P-type ATPase [Kineosporiaceae bacterium]